MSFKQKYRLQLPVPASSPMFPDATDAVWKLLNTRIYIPPYILSSSLFLRVRKWCPWSPYEAGAGVLCPSVCSPQCIRKASESDQCQPAGSRRRLLRSWSAGLPGRRKGMKRAFADNHASLSCRLSFSLTGPLDFFRACGKVKKCRRFVDDWLFSPSKNNEKKDKTKQRREMTLNTKIKTVSE